MEVKITVQSVPREIIVETDDTQAEVEMRLEAALGAYLESGAHRSPIFTITAAKGGKILIPADKIAFIEFSTDQTRRVGFGNIV